MTTWTINAVQGLAALIGITFGAIPLVQFLTTGAAGSLWALLFDDTTGTIGWAGPLAVVAVATLVITVLQRSPGDRA